MMACLEGKLNEMGDIRNVVLTFKTQLNVLRIDIFNMKMSITVQKPCHEKY